jgi:hypothetical protein
MSTSDSFGASMPTKKPRSRLASFALLVLCFAANFWQGDGFVCKRTTFSWVDQPQRVQQRGVRNSGSSSLKAVASDDNLETMKLPELKKYFKLLGGTPGQMRKSELLEACQQLTLTEATTPSTASSKSGIDNGQLTDATTPLPTTKTTASKLDIGWMDAAASKLSDSSPKPTSSRRAMAPLPHLAGAAASSSELDSGSTTKDDAVGADQDAEELGNKKEKKKKNSRFPTGSLRDERLTVTGSDMDLRYDSFERGCAAVVQRFQSVCAGFMQGAALRSGCKAVAKRLQSDWNLQNLCGFCVDIAKPQRSDCTAIVQ